MKGRPKTPGRLRALQGERSPIPPLIPSPELPEEPAWHQLVGKGRPARDARAEWRRITAVLTEYKLLSTLDEQQLIDRCVNWARLLECERRISEEGLTLETPRGPQKHPLLSAANQLRISLRHSAEQLGLTPLARQRLRVPPPEANKSDLLP